LINTADDIREEWFSGGESVERIGLTAGASTPQFLVEGVIRRLIDLSGGKAEVHYQRKPEGVQPLFRENATSRDTPDNSASLEKKR
jgi:4-hydroxy-3-methylbut-2-enyl diphosphate reductase